MILIAVLYVILAFASLIALCGMILKIGNMIGDCPETGARAQTAALTITTGFAAIGAGGVTLIGAILPLMENAPAVALLLALGMACLCLGLGFTHAIGTLRLVVHQGNEPFKQNGVNSSQAGQKPT